MIKRPSVNKTLTKSLDWPSYLFFGLFIFICIQMIPLPKIIIKILSPGSYAFRSQFITSFESVKYMSFSMIPAHTLREGLELLSYFILGILIIKTINRKRQILRIVYAIVAMGAFQAFYGLFELYRNNPRILFYNKVYSLGEVTGTFVNSNHLSGYLEMVIPLALGLIIARIDFFSFSALFRTISLVL